ncbi:DEAD/DEAH box helicase [Candidatus Bathyarchaeota archaeon]|nr:DEAD/DEAH box helicase [Candidatus Bathyarchaeota archaeon]
MNPSVFEGLHPMIKEGLEQLGIVEPTPPQERVIPAIQEGDNVLLVSPTASGKTEAALLPVFDMFLRGKKEKGISIIYITPLRALNRDIEKRMMFWADHLGITVEVRHGDTSQKQRSRQTRKPPQMLITTPETLQAILPSKGMRKHLAPVRWVIIDEIHDLAASKRGAQLTVGLERLDKAADKKPQRIGLSATIGNPKTVAEFLGGIHPVNTVEVEVDKTYEYKVQFPQPTDADFDLADELSTSPKAASRLNRIKRLVDQHNSTLIFVQGRGQAEALGFRLKQMGPGIEVHHGSLSREQRHETEDMFKAGELKGIVCTSTLQLGIDIGEVDLTIQYQSPRQVSALIQRVGRAGHTLSRLSEGVTIPAYGEDALESLVASDLARKKRLEPTLVHMKPLDVLTHQIVGLTVMALDDGIGQEEVLEMAQRAYPFKEYTGEEDEELIEFLRQIGLIKREGKTMKKTGKGRRYYYENLGMINDERRYPFINAITDEMVGTVGDEFWSLRARVGLNVILRGRVWRILQIDEERGVLHALPSTDPLGAAPGWDGELIPVTREVAEGAGTLRETIYRSAESLDDLVEPLDTDVGSLKEIADESITHLKSGLPLPSSSNLILEVWDQYLVIHSTRGEKFNMALGAILDAALSEKDLIYNWWNDPYRILIEAPNKLNKYEIEDIETLIKSLTPEEADRLLSDFMHARFPFGYKMNFIAQRFGVIPRGKMMGPERTENLYYRFKDTPIYKETIREAYHEKLDLDAVKEVVTGIQGGSVEVITKQVTEPSALARHILEKYADVEELMATDATITDQIEYMRQNIHSRRVRLACVSCGEWHTHVRIRELDDHPLCIKCGSGLMAMMRRNQDPEHFHILLRRWNEGAEMFGDDLDMLRHGRKTADMVLSYGRKAVEALMVYGVGPVTSYQVLSRMHRSNEEFYKDLLKAKIQYMKTRQYWADKK